MILTGYIDDSGDGKEIFTLSCLLAENIDWTWIEVDWKNLIESKNRELLKLGRTQISRYHAADCSSRLGEFAGWTVDEQKDFTNKMLDIFRKQEMVNTISYSLNLRELSEELPWTEDSRMEWAHKLCLSFMMLELGNQIADAEPTIPVKIVLIHDRSTYNGVMLEAFTRLIQDTSFAYKKFFSTISPMGWENCIALQAADLMAYESFKDTQRHTTKRNRRYTLKELLAMGCFSGRSRRFERDNLKELANVYKNINPQWK